MRELTQAFVDRDQDGVPGDCWRTAIACLLDMDRDDVPHFAHLYPDPEPNWWVETVRWVEAQKPGMTLVGAEPVYGVVGRPVIASGPSPRGPWLHSVIADGTTGELLWDPHPSHAGLAGDAVDLVWLMVRPDA